MLRTTKTTKIKQINKWMNLLGHFIKSFLIQKLSKLWLNLINPELRQPEIDFEEFEVLNGKAFNEKLTHTFTRSKEPILMFQFICLYC